MIAWTQPGRRMACLCETGRFTFPVPSRLDWGLDG